MRSGCYFLWEGIKIGKCLSHISFTTILLNGDHPVICGSDGQLQRSRDSMSLRQSALVDLTSKGCMDISLEVDLCTSLRLQVMRNFLWLMLTW